MVQIYSRMALLHSYFNCHIAPLTIFILLHLKHFKRKNVFSKKQFNLLSDGYILLVKSECKEAFWSIEPLVKEPCRRRELWGTERLKWKAGVKDNFSCVPFQWDAEWVNDSQFGKWDLIFFWVKKHLVISLVVSIFKAMCLRNWEDSVTTWNTHKDPKCLSSVFQLGHWAQMSNFWLFTGRPVG